jgi:signal transduction histidine kinase
MNRRILIQITTPAVLIGLLLLGSCLAGAWYVSRLQTKLSDVLRENVASQKAAQELEIRLRQLQYHSLIYLMEPNARHRELWDEDHRALEASLDETQETAHTAEQKHLVREIKDNYDLYLADINNLVAKAAAGGTPSELIRFADTHPLSKVVEPFQELLKLNKEMMDQSAEDSRRVARQAKWTMFLIGLVGPAGGLLAGFGIARGISQSIYQLSVRVRDIAQSLEQDVASVSIEANGDLQTLDRQLQHVVGRVEEITERQQRHQREMLRAEQLASVGRLAAGLAHEIRNPLTAIKMLVEVALRSENRKPLQTEDLRVIHSEIVRLEQTVQGLLDFARLPAPQRRECDLRRVVSDAAELVKARCRGQKVELAVRCPGFPVVAEVDSAQMRTVLVNLLLNALDAMPQGGHLELTLDAPPSGGVRLSVADTGTGIAPEIAERLFLPFTTTKETGTGLGLSISRRIVEEHGGSLSAANRPEGGACFTITLPCIHAALPATTS